MSREPLTPESAAERAKSTPGIFGDTPTAGVDPADSVVTKDQSQATENLAEARSEADDDETFADDASAAEVVRQTDAAAAEEAGVFDEADDDDDDDDNRRASDVVDDIESAESVEEVDALADGDERVTVQRAADKKREELSE